VLLHRPYEAVPLAPFRKSEGVASRLTVETRTVIAGQRVNVDALRAEASDSRATGVVNPQRTTVGFDGVDAARVVSYFYLPHGPTPRRWASLRDQPRWQSR
jgi:hypothetical protein